MENPSTDWTPHTPGPWKLGKVNEDVEGGAEVDIDSPEGFHWGLATVVWRIQGDERSPRCEADAKLIAAAPDLLAALKWIASQQNLFFAECTQAEEIVVRAREAIAKATA